MKSLSLLLLLTAFTAFSCVHAQMGGPSGSSSTSSSSATDDMNSISGIRRPTPAPGSSVASGKPLAASLATDAKGNSPTTNFPSTIPKIYLAWTDGTGTKGEKLRVVWIAEDAAGISTKNKKLTEGSETLPGPGSVGTFYLPAPKGGFPVGKYRVEMYEDSKLAKTLRFSVVR